LVFVFLFSIELAKERKITDNQNSDGRVPSVGLLGNILPMNCMSYTNGINLCIKLFIDVVCVCVCVYI
jgi:hypothetical protein